MYTDAKSSNLPDYFTCTLGEAARRLLDSSDLKTINDFIDHQAQACPDDFAVGFPVPGHEYHDWSYRLLTFEDLRNGSLAIAGQLAPMVPRATESSEPECVALLCSSSVNFLFAWLAFMRAGYSVLLIAPQCQPVAIAHLCNSCGVSTLFRDDSLTDLASKAVSKSNRDLLAVDLPCRLPSSFTSRVFKNLKEVRDIQPLANANAMSTAFIFHTSGTSTGLPKPILQSHHAAFGVLPFLDGRKSATFTTTPLYHGGIADCFRAWTSKALIWLFPGADTPITTRNINFCLLITAKATLEASAARVRYFSCVPYILQMLVEDVSGIDILKGMELVGVGGAALSQNIGDDLVGNGINLVSRFGSAECGFLLSSNRNYNMDKNWQYLRLSAETDFLYFEKQDDFSGLSELIVRRGWPHMAKTNREDGSFATGDLFEQHHIIKGAWRYHSRSDSQITLSTGKKFDPAPLEDVIASSSPLIREVLVFGSGRQNPGILVFPSNESLNMKDSVVKEKIWEAIEASNCTGQDHTRLGRDKVVVMSATHSLLERSSKGTLSRRTVEEKFAEAIRQAYTNNASPTTKKIGLPTKNGDLRHCVRKAVIEVLGADHCIDDDADFFIHGVDSTACTQIRSLLQKDIVQNQHPLPWNIVYDCGNITRLSQFLLESRNGDVKSLRNGETEMLDLVSRYSETNFVDSARNVKQHAKSAPFVVLLTGATGALGAQILEILRCNLSVSRIVCLVRAKDHFAAKSRVSASLVKQKKVPLDILDTTILCVPCKLSSPDLGLSATEFSHIQQSVTHIIHAAWAVNFSLSLKSFVDEHIAGMSNILSLALSCSNAVHVTFCSSTASVLGHNPPLVIEERTSSSPSDAGSSGYSRSKWVAEAICAATSKRLPGTVKILRIGQLTGDTENGVWNMSEAWPLMLSTVDALGCLPQIEEPLSWLPLNTAATAVVDIAFQNVQSTISPQVYHLVNNSRETTWSDLLSWIEAIKHKPFNVVSPSVWLDKLENFPENHPAKNLLGLWRDAYGNDNLTEECSLQEEKITFSTEEAQKESGVMAKVQPIDQILVNKIWSWLDGEIRAAKE